MKPIGDMEFSGCLIDGRAKRLKASLICIEYRARSQQAAGSRFN